MTFSLFSIFLVILWIVLGTSFTKLHPFLVLLTAAFFLAFLLGIAPLEALSFIQKGFGKNSTKHRPINSIWNRNWGCLRKIKWNHCFSQWNSKISQ